MRRVIFTDSHSILASWRNHFSYLLNVHGVNVVMQTEIHINQRIVPESCAFEVLIATGKLKRPRSPDVDQIPTELIKAGGKTICSEIHKPINSIWKKVELS
jgi:hypothetical protein